jgi:hypothetical protein
MSQTSSSSFIYQLRVVLRDISPLIWRRILLSSDSTLKDLHAILQISFDWSDESLYAFRIHGKEYGYSGADSSIARLEEFRFHKGEKFLYLYDFTSGWECDIRLEGVMPGDPRRQYPICIDGKRAAPPEDCLGPKAYIERLDRHILPIEDMRIAANAVESLMKADPDSLIRDAIEDMDELEEAVHRLDAYYQFRPEHFERRKVNALLRAWVRNQGGRHDEDKSANGNDR